ncbi:hypothetical protein DMJ13_08520 [halophilic archaeon]|nr:hypothetical protein DMJ13_08520 [halophilic archaeon]
MVWYAVEALDDAVEPVRSLLFPLDVRQWLKLAFVVLFLGGSGATPPMTGTGTPGGVDGGTVTTDDAFVAPDGSFVPSETLVAAAVALVLLGLLVALAFALVGSVMEFAFFESLRRQRVHVRRYARDNLRKGLGLFAFRVVLFLVVFVPVVGLALLLFPGLATGSPAVVVGALALFVPAFVVLSFVVALVDGFTTNFVVPVMLLRDEGVLDGWRTFWPTLRREWKQFAVFALLRIVLAIAAGIAVSLVGGFLAAVVLVPFAVVAVGVVVGFGGVSALISSTAGLVVAGLLAVAYVAVFLFVLAVVRVPVQAYLRYYALLVLGDADAALDLIPDLRSDVRGEESV